LLVMWCAESFGRATSTRRSSPRRSTRTDRDRGFRWLTPQRLRRRATASEPRAPGRRSPALPARLALHPSYRGRNAAVPHTGMRLAGRSWLTKAGHHGRDSDTSAH
jgi:hypothetical protein